MSTDSIRGSTNPTHSPGRYRSACRRRSGATTKTELRVWLLDLMDVEARIIELVEDAGLQRHDEVAQHAAGELRLLPQPRDCVMVLVSRHRETVALQCVRTANDDVDRGRQTVGNDGRQLHRVLAGRRRRLGI